MEQNSKGGIDFNSNEWVRGDDDFRPNLTCKQIRDMLIKASITPVWISVKKLPEESKAYKGVSILVMVTDGRMDGDGIIATEICRYEFGIEKWIYPENILTPTHWKHLPTPPIPVINPERS